MSRPLTSLWERLFLEYRPSLGLAFFRIAVAVTVGFHVLPSFFHLEDNYLSPAYKTVNLSFFTPGVIDLVQQSPNWLVCAFVLAFCLMWFCFLIGLFAQMSCILMTACCYYFYALNCFHIGTLSWDILLVTLFLMCISPYHGDYFSIDALRSGDVNIYRRKRPFFIQRLLQMQIAATYFYTALYKITGGGNWLTDNPIYYLLNYPPEGVTKQFIGREFFASQPQLCYWSGILIVVIEIALPFLLFIPRTRLFAIGAGCFFHVVLIVTLHVPTIFFFLFPPQLLLFINPNKLIYWIEKRRENNFSGGQAKIIYDGHCQFCVNSLKKLMVMDLFGYLKPVDYQTAGNVQDIHPQLTKEACHSQLHLVEPDGRLYGGFFIFRRLCFKIPMLWPFFIFFYFPGTGLVGPWVYRWVAKNRYLFHRNKVCHDNSCYVTSQYLKLD